jgi:chromosome segregation ATPase
MAEAQAHLNDAQKDFDRIQTAADAASAKAKEADAKYKQLKSVADAAKKTLATAKAKLAKLEKSLAIKEAVNKQSIAKVKYNKPKGQGTSGLSTTQKQSATQQGKVTSQTTPTATSTKAAAASDDMPQTGNGVATNVSFIGMIGLAFASLLGIAVDKRKRA